MIIGLTGGIGSGKSTVSKILKNCGIEIVDADIIAKEIFKSENIQKEILEKLGETDRKKLKEMVFNNPLKLELLNKIIHPKLIEQLEQIKKNKNKNQILIFDVPLLFETGIDNLCDKTIVVDIELEKQIDRIMKRDNIEKELAEKIIKSQMSIEEKIKRADVVIENNGTLDDLEKKVLNIYIKLKEEEKSNEYNSSSRKF
ncbi:dephospho-CoA kinase [Cetobacterium sp. 2A]|uniref:dephospho-CoA kinase n=1 Tax=Cetobacterium sp. 2A TaxID=2754723 RepID=UPI00163CE1A5|nr:dephospho-CoA kinase [Cetobacterium sp. 2A]MBC2856397.1 dephospho-CoA kinase [Cetobacterium sp. 2A]